MKISVVQKILIILVAVLSIVATVTGIFSNDGNGEYIYHSIRGQQISIYGKGLYKHMSSEVAIQGIAQDYVTLFLAVPLVLIALYQSHRGSLRWNYILSGIVAYLFSTYLFYLNLAMYNQMFLAYVALVGCSFFALLIQVITQLQHKINASEKQLQVFRHAGLFLMVNGVLIVLLWLSIIMPPLFDGTIIPKAVEHYTTLPVQGLDLSLFLPLSFVAGFFAWKSKPNGTYYVLVYCIALTILMTALCAKILFMGMQGANIIPVIFIMPTITLVALFFSARMLASVK